MDWSDYQDKVGGLFRGLGLAVQINQQVEGARAVHAVDVVVRFQKYGINILWIVECKYWQTAIPKEKVMVLQQIAQDVGADRAFLFAEAGFQAGAVRAVEHTNVTLTSYDDLAAHLVEVELALLSDRLAKLDHRILLWFSDSADRPGPRPGVDFDQVVSLSADLLIIKQYWARAVANAFPIFTMDGPINSRPKYLRYVERVLETTETQLDQLEAEAEIYRVQLAQSVERFALAVEDLLLSGKSAAIGHHPCPEEAEKALLRAHADMKKIGDCLEEVSKRISGKPRKHWQSLRSLLVDGIYLHLMTSELNPNIWQETEDEVRRLLTALRGSLVLPLRRCED